MQIAYVSHATTPTETRADVIKYLEDQIANTKRLGVTDTRNMYTQRAIGRLQVLMDIRRFMAELWVENAQYQDPADVPAKITE